MLPTEFDQAWRLRGKETSNFRRPVGKKIMQVNLYDPHAQVEADLGPGPGHYNNEKYATISSEHVTRPSELERFEKGARSKLTAAFVEENTDRFGAPIRSKRAVVLPPGPADYDAKRFEILSPRGGYMNKQRRVDM